jgi:CubicO group peptidase (beta-lactamase class C family)
MLGLVILAVAIAAQARADQVDDFVLAQMQKLHIPAVSIAVLKHGKVVKANGYGLANLELDVRATPDTVYQIGSVSKQFIAAGILLLERDGRLRLDDPVRQYMEDAPAAWQPITLRHLLTHTSGLVRESPIAQVSQQSNVEAVRAAYGTPLLFKPGEKMQYSNLGYFTLAEVITRAAGKPWPQFIEERIFAPLQMHATRTTTNDELVPHRAGGYVWADDRFRNAQLVPMVRPSGAFISTVRDLAKWDAALYSDAILTAAQRQQMWTPVTLNDGSTQPYGFGWDIGKAGQHRLVRHAGAMLGYRSELSRYVDDGLTVVVLTNLFAAPTEGFPAASRRCTSTDCSRSERSRSCPPRSWTHSPAGTSSPAPW